MAVQTNVSVQNRKENSLITPWNIIFAVLVLVGVFCWGLQLTKGLQITNLGTTNMWGLYIVGFMISTGVAAGSLLFASVPYLFNLDEFKPYTRIAAYLGAIASIVAASLFIIVDIGNPERVWLFITSGNFTSPMFWDFLILACYMVLSVIFTRQLIQVQEGKKEESSVKPIAVISFIAGILVVVTSFVFSFQVARPLWNNPVQPISFLFSALVAALTVQMILAVLLNKSGYIRMPMNLVGKMAKITAALLCLELIIVVAEVLMGLYPGAGSEYEAIMWLVAGEGAVGFWLELVVLVAAVIFLGKAGSSKGSGVVVGALLALVAIYLIKSNFLQVELFNPLISYAGPPVYGGTTGPYVPNLIEIGLALGIISFGALLFNFGLKKLNLGNGKTGK